MKAPFLISMANQFTAHVMAAHHIPADNQVARETERALNSPDGISHGDRVSVAIVGL